MALGSILDEELISNHIPGILHHPSGGLNAMIQNDAQDDLKRLYVLFLRINDVGLSSLKQGVKDWIKERGNRINEGFSSGAEGLSTHTEDNKPAEASANPGAGVGNSAALQWVSEVIDLRDKFLTILGRSFDNNKILQTCIDEAFSAFINANKRSAEFISLFIDDKLKKGLKGVRFSPQCILGYMIMHHS